MPNEQEPWDAEGLAEAVIQAFADRFEFQSRYALLTFAHFLTFSAGDFRDIDTGVNFCTYPSYMTENYDGAFTDEYRVRQGLEMIYSLYETQGLTPYRSSVCLRASDQCWRILRVEGLAQ